LIEPNSENDQRSLINSETGFELKTSVWATTKIRVSLHLYRVAFFFTFGFIKVIPLPRVISLYLFVEQIHLCSYCSEFNVQYLLNNRNKLYNY
jgi:hypothetical protein